MTETVALNPPDSAWKASLGLSTRRPPELYEESAQVGNAPHAGALRTAFDDLGLSAVFCVEHVPTVAILVGEYERGAAATLHAALWNQGLANLLVVVSGETIRLFSLSRFPRADDDFDRCLVDELNAVTDALTLRNLAYAAESGRFWEQEKYREYFDPRERVDRVLLDNLTESHRLLCDTDLPTEAAQALLVQTTFIAYLEDREIIDAEYLRDATSSDAETFEALLDAGDGEALEHLFRTLRQDFNGDLFVAPCSFETDDRGPRLDASHLTVLARFRAGREEMHGSIGQYRLWKYNFKYIPIELISAVHDRFLAERGPESHASGAYYTPMFLADTVVSQVWDALPAATPDSGCFLDPACGSGIFLVRVFQRLCEHRRKTQRGRTTIPWSELLDLLSRMRGWDVDGGAVRVAVFSLYVALLEEVRPPDIRKLMARGRVLPPLHGETLHRGDFFAVAPDDAQVDVVIGNPPWSSRHGERHSALDWCKREGLPAPGREQAWPFVWKALRHLQGDGVAALLLPAMGFLHNHARPAVEARKRLMREARVCSVVNFADMRFQLFDRALRPTALIVFGRPKADIPYRFDYLAPKADLNLKSRRLITIGSGDRRRLDSRQVDADPSVFKKRLWMTEPEARLFNYLSRLPRLGDLAVEFGTLARKRKSAQNRWVVGQGFKPANVERLDSDAYHRERSTPVATLPYLPIEHFRLLAGTSRGLRPRKDGVVHRRGFEAGFSGPRVLVPHGIAAGPAGPRLRAAYVDEPLTFQHVVQAITASPGDGHRGRLLAGLLNSRVMLWFAFHGTSSFGSERPKVQQAELLRLPFPAPDNLPDPQRSRSAADALITVIEEQGRQAREDLAPPPDECGVLDEIDKLAYEFFCLSETERILVEDTVEHTIPAAQPNRGNLPEIWNSSTPSDRRAYARTLVDNLMDWLDDDCALGTRLVARNDDLAVLRLSLRDGRHALDYAEDDKTPVGEALSRLSRRIEQPLPGNFQSTPDFRVFLDRDLFLVKPAAKRFWLRSAAVADAHGIALDLQGFVGRRHGDRPGPD